MHQTLLNAEIASVWYLFAKNENVYVSGSLKRSQRCCTDICCKYRGYKNEVIEERIFCSSSHKSLPKCKVEVVYENGKSIVMNDTVVV